MVFSIIGLLALSALAAYNTVIAQHRSAKTLADVTAVRTAVLKWAGGGPLAYPQQNCIVSSVPATCANPLTLQEWDSLAPHLPHHLKKLADGDSDLTLDGANPWNGRYDIQAPAPSSPMRWKLEVHDVPCGVRDELRHQLRKTDATDVLQTGTCPGVNTLTVQYDE